MKCNGPRILLEFDPLYDKKKVKKLTSFLDQSNELWVKSTYHVMIAPHKYFGPEPELYNFSTSILIKSINPKQRFYSNLKMIESSIEDLKEKASGGNLIVKIRELTFIKSQVYIKTADNAVLKLECGNGFIALKISDKVYRSIIRQLKHHGRNCN